MHSGQILRGCLQLHVHLHHRSAVFLFLGVFVCVLLVIGVGVVTGQAQCVGPVYVCSFCTLVQALIDALHFVVYAPFTLHSTKAFVDANIKHVLFSDTLCGFSDSARLG